MTEEEKQRSYEYYKQWQINKARYRNESIGYALMFGIGLLFILKNWQDIFVCIGVILIFLAIYFIFGIVNKWEKKNKALLDLKNIAEELDATDISINNKNGSISFTVLSEIMDENLDKIEKFLSDKDLTMKVTRTKCLSKDNMMQAKNDNSNLKYTDIGYINKNEQRNNGKTNLRGNDNNQFYYNMECLKCGYTYFSNGSNIWQRKCPSCQGGKDN